MAFTYAGEFAGAIWQASGGTSVVLEPNTPVTVCNGGTTNVATLYTSRTKGTTATNPVSSTPGSLVNFFADPGTYDLYLGGTIAGGVLSGGTLIQNVPVAADPSEPPAMATTVTGPDAFGAPSVVGTGILSARQDHDHGLPADPRGFPLSGTGITGATVATRFAGGTTSGSPASGTFSAGDYVITQTGSIWICTVGGTPGTWVSGVGITWRNSPTFAIQASTAYAINDALEDAGGSWRCILAYTTGASPTVPSLDTTHWTFVAQQGATGTTGSTGATGAAGSGSELAYAEVTGTGTSFTNTAVADWAGLSITFTAPTSGQVMLVAHSAIAQQSVSGDGWIFEITDSANNVQDSDWHQASAANAPMGTSNVSKRLTGLTPGNSYTYKVRQNAVTGGTVSVNTFGAAGSCAAFIRAVTI